MMRTLATPNRVYNAMSYSSKQRACMPALVLGLVLLLTACDTSGPIVNDTPPDTTAWLALGPNGSSIDRLRLFDPYLYAMAGEHGLWRLDVRDPDSTWQFLGLDSTVAQGHSVGPADVMVHPEHADWLLATYRSDDFLDHSVYRSLDDGMSWQPADSSLFIVFGEDSLFIKLRTLFGYPDRVLADGTYETPDFGQTWTRILDESSTIGGRIAVRHPRNPDLIWKGGEATTMEPSLAYTPDAGHEWIKLDFLIRPAASQQGVTSIGLVPSNEAEVYVGLTRSLVKTSDMGQSWAVLDTGGDFARHTAIVVNPRQERHVWVVIVEQHVSRLIETWDGGATWQPVATPEAMLPRTLLWEEEGEVLYVGTENGVYRYRPNPLTQSATE